MRRTRITLRRGRRRRAKILTTAATAVVLGGCTTTLEDGPPPMGSYDRNLRIVQNLFRALEPGDERLLLVIGGSHVAVLRQMLDFTPQMCAVDALSYLETRG